MRVRHAYWNALLQVTIVWLTITFTWTLFLWLTGGPWLLIGAAVGAFLPIPLTIVSIPYFLTWIGDRISQRRHGRKITLD